MAVTATPARLIQSTGLMVRGSPTLIIERGRAIFTLFLGETTLGAGRDRRVGAAPLLSAISRPPISQTDGGYTASRRQ
jgi:hypothetical protein